MGIWQNRNNPKALISQAVDCVEVALTADFGRVVRDSKRQDGALLIVSREGWRVFLRQFC
ncbi:DUF397 domain-containing protein [Streptomyces sp. 15-116A]|uniref:DUF397 domain-containing protein n=1 Tax=Streptomyces sp. 15-116A TaxID=2259035 RepID=UPI0037D9C87E